MQYKAFFKRLGYVIVECRGMKPQPTKTIEVANIKLKISKKRWLTAISKQELQWPCAPPEKFRIIQRTACNIRKATTGIAREVALRDLAEVIKATPADVLWLTRMQLGTFGRNKRGQIISYKPNRDKYTDERLTFLSSLLYNGRCYAKHCPVARKCSHYGELKDEIVKGD